MDYISIGAITKHCRAIDLHAIRLMPSPVANFAVSFFCSTLNIKQDQEKKTAMVDSLKDIRCFIGVSAPDSLATQLNKQAKEWRDQGLYPDFKWTKKQDYHVTLHFIGETPHAQVHRLIDELTNSKLIQNSSPPWQHSQRKPALP